MFDPARWQCVAPVSPTDKAFMKNAEQEITFISNQLEYPECVAERAIDGLDHMWTYLEWGKIMLLNETYIHMLTISNIFLILTIILPFA